MTIARVGGSTQCRPQVVETRFDGHQSSRMDEWLRGLQNGRAQLPRTSGPWLVVDSPRRPRRGFRRSRVSIPEFGAGWRRPWPTTTVGRRPLQYREDTVHNKDDVAQRVAASPRPRWAETPSCYLEELLTVTAHQLAWQRFDLCATRVSCHYRLNQVWYISPIAAREDSLFSRDSRIVAVIGSVDAHVSGAGVWPQRRR